MGRRGLAAASFSSGAQEAVVFKPRFRNEKGEKIKMAETNDRVDETDDDYNNQRLHTLVLAVRGT